MAFIPARACHLLARGHTHNHWIDLEGPRFVCPPRASFRRSWRRIRAPCHGSIAVFYGSPSSVLFFRPILVLAGSLYVCLCSLLVYHSFAPCQCNLFVFLSDSLHVGNVHRPTRRAASAPTRARTLQREMFLCAAVLLRPALACVCVSYLLQCTPTPLILCAFLRVPGPGVDQP